MNDKYLTESLDILKREFGQPLPTLEDTMKAHKIKKEGGPGSGPQPGGGKKQDDEPKSDKPKSVQKNTIIKNKMIQRTVLNDLMQQHQEAKEIGDEEKMEKLARKHNLHKWHYEAQKLALDVIEDQGDFNIDKVKEVVAGDPEKTSSEDLNAAISEVNDLIDDIKSEEDYDMSEVKQLSKLRRRLKEVG